MLKRFLARFKPSAQPKLAKADIIIVAIGVLIFTGLGLYTIARSSIWFDEAFSAYIIRFNFIEIWQFTAADVHPPLYYWFLKLWSMIFGTSELGLRSMSVFFGAIAVIFSYLLAHRFFGRRGALYALGVLIVSPMIIRYSQEMRMYTLVAAIALAASYVLVRATDTGKRKLWVLYGVLLGLGMWTHYFAAIVWLAHWAWRALEIRTRGQSTKVFMQKFFTRDWVVAHVVAVGVFLAWLPAMVYQVVNVQANGFWIPPVTPTTITNFVTNSLFYLDQSEVQPWLTLIFMVLVAALSWLGVRGYKRLKKDQKRGYILLLCVAFVPPLLLILASMPPLQSAFIDRYLVPSSFAIAILIGVTLSFAHKEIGSKLLRYGLILLVAGSLITGVVNVYRYGNYNKVNGNSSGAKQVMQQVLEVAAPGQPIVAGSPWMYYDAVFYQTEANPVFFMNQGTDYRYSSLDMLEYRETGKIMDIDAFLGERSTFWWLVGTSEDRAHPPKTSRSLTQIQELTQSDPTTGKPAYRAIEYRVN